MKKIIAITGKIGSGKSTLTSFLEKSFAVFTIDKIQKNLYQENKILWNMVKQKYPEFIINNQVDKKNIKLKMMNNFKFKSQYQTDVVDVLFPYLYQKFKNMSGLIFVEIPYINSIKIAKLFDLIVVVKAEIKTRTQRIMKRDNLSLFEAEKWIKASVENIKLQNCITIKNDQNLYELEKQLTKVFRWIIL